MARGWESKAIESQQEDRDQARTAAGPLSAEEAARVAARQRIAMSRARVSADLALARSAAHRHTLEAAIRALDEEEKELDRT